MAPLDPGTTVGDFRIVRLLRAGPGAGAVYEATGGGLDRPVAVKVFAERLSGSREFRERFRREAPRIAAVEHPNIARTYEAGSSGHGLYLAMRLVHGPTLAEHVGRGPLEPGVALELLGPVADALDLAHASGVLHRDLKPEKIIVSESHGAFLTGFSIARSRARGKSSRNGREPYEPPEQARGEPLRRRGEVYSFGVVLYEALTGRRPSRGESVEAKTGAGSNGSSPSPGAALPEQLDEILGRALAEDPNERPGTAGELVADLRRALDAPARAAGRFTPTGRGEGVAAPAGAAAAPGRLAPAPPVQARERPASGPVASDLVASGDRPLPDSRRTAAARLERRRARTLATKRRRALRAAPGIAALVAAAALAGWYAPSLLGSPEDPREPSAAQRADVPAPTSDAYAGALSRALERLNGRRATLARRLERARTARGQAGTASALAQAHTAAATALAAEPRTPQERRANTAIVGALRELAAAYRGMAAAGRRGDARAFGGEAARVRRGEARVRSAVRGLTALGYSLE